MTIIKAAPNTIYSVSENFVRKLENNQVQIKWGSNTLRWHVVGRTGDGFNILFN